MSTSHTDKKDIKMIPLTKEALEALAPEKRTLLAYERIERTTKLNERLRELGAFQEDVHFPYKKIAIR